MSASRGAAEEIVWIAVPDRMSAIETPAPVIAATRGIPPARIEPNAMTRTTRAMSTPAPSVSETPGLVRPYAVPPNATSAPLSRKFTPAASMSARMRSVISAPWSASCAEIIAARPSGLIAPVTSGPSGSRTDATDSSSSRAATASAIAAGHAPSSTR